MKRHDLIRKIEGGGFLLLRATGPHDVYARGAERLVVPRHKEINEHTAREILRDAGLR